MTWPLLIRHLQFELPPASWQCTQARLITSAHREDAAAETWAFRPPTWGGPTSTQPWMACDCPGAGGGSGICCNYSTLHFLCRKARGKRVPTSKRPRPPPHPSQLRRSDAAACERGLPRGWPLASAPRNQGLAGLWALQVRGPFGQGGAAAFEIAKLPRRRGSTPSSYTIFFHNGILLLSQGSPTHTARRHSSRCAPPLPPCEAPRSERPGWCRPGAAPWRYTPPRLRQPAGPFSTHCPLYCNAPFSSFSPPA